MARIRSSIWRHLGRGEALAHQRAHAGVPGRVEGQERHELVGVGPEGAGLEGHPVGVGEPVEIAEGGQHVLVAGQGPEVELVVAVDRRFVPEPGVDRIRVLVDLVVVGAVGDAVSVIAGWPASSGVPRRRGRPGHQQIGGAGHELGNVHRGHVAHARRSAALPRRWSPAP